MAKYADSPAGRLVGLEEASGTFARREERMDLPER